MTDWIYLGLVGAYALTGFALYRYSLAAPPREAAKRVRRHGPQPEKRPGDDGF